MDVGTYVTLKLHLKGTHRLIPPDETWRKIQPWLSRFGITRVAPVTGLDVVGIPTVMVVRPDSRGLSVTQGKGIDLVSARVSGAMEAIEHAIAENIQRDRLYGSAGELSSRHRVARVERFSPRARALRADHPTLWMAATDLTTRETVLCPYESIHLDFRLPLPPGSGYFAMSSNGLASGNNLTEATCHALFEVIERDATARFYAMPAERQAERRVQRCSITDPISRALLERYDRAEVDVAVWDLTSELGVPTYLCDVMDQSQHTLRGLQRARGVGCHSAREVALVRALCEAAQSRLTLIAGSRDDIAADELGIARSAQALERARAQMAGDGTRVFEHSSAPVFESFDAELSWLIERLNLHGYDEVLRVPLCDDPAFPFAVVRVVVPGLRALDPHGHAEESP